MSTRISLSFKPLSTFSSSARQWLSQRSSREQMLIFVAMSVLGLWLLWTVLFSPLRDWRENLERDAGAWERRLHWLETQPRTQTRSELRPSVLTSSTGDCGLQLLRVNQEAEAILVTVQEQSFLCLLDWFIRLESDHGIQVEQLRLQAGQRLGGVSGTIRFAE